MSLHVVQEWNVSPRLWKRPSEALLRKESARAADRERVQDRLICKLRRLAAPVSKGRELGARCLRGKLARTHSSPCRCAVSGPPAAGGQADLHFDHEVVLVADNALEIAGR